MILPFGWFRARHMIWLTRRPCEHDALHRQQTRYYTRSNRCTIDTHSNTSFLICKRLEAQHMYGMIQNKYWLLFIRAMVKTTTPSAISGAVCFPSALPQENRTCWGSPRKLEVLTIVLEAVNFWIHYSKPRQSEKQLWSFGQIAFSKQKTRLRVSVLLHLSSLSWNVISYQARPVWQ